MNDMKTSVLKESRSKIFADHKYLDEKLPIVLLTWHISLHQNLIVANFFSISKREQFAQEHKDDTTDILYFTTS